MQFLTLLTLLSSLSLVLAQTPTQHLTPRQTVGDTIFNAICGANFVRCDQRLGTVGQGYCCRNSNQCVQGNGTLLTCADGTVARPYQTSLFPCFAQVVQTASPAAYTSVLAGITGGAGALFFPSSLLAQITAQTGDACASASAAAESSTGAASHVGGAPMGMGVGPILVVLGVWVLAAVGGMGVVFAR